MSVVLVFSLIIVCLGSTAFADDYQPETILGRQKPVCSYLRICTFTNVYITKPQQFKINNYRRQKTNVNTIIFVNSTLQFIPSSMFQYMPELTTIDCVHCELSEINRNDFKNAANLRTINFSYNNVAALIGNCFSEALNLLEINLSSNQIGTININAFDSLAKLKVLNLENNQIKTVSSGHFESLKSLEILNLGKNLMTGHITVDIFQHNKHLTSLNLNHNRIMTVNSSVVSSYKNLEYLNLDSNQITQFSLANRFEGMKMLNVSYNNLTNLNIQFDVGLILARNNLINEFTVKYPESVVLLELELNKLENVDFIAEMINLTYLDLSQNPMNTPFNASNLAALPLLKYLYLGNVYLQSINHETFAYQTNLEVLDISYNKLKKIDLIDFSNMMNLEFLYIDGNSLTHIDDISDLDIFCPSLMVLGISDNKFNCKHLREIVKKLKDIHVAMYTDRSLLPSQTNFRGIACFKNATDDNDLTSGNVSFPKILPEHKIIDIPVRKDNELIETQRALNFSQSEYKRLQNQLETMQMSLEALQTSLVSYQTDNKRIAIQQELNAKIDYFIKTLQTSDTKPSIDKMVETPESFTAIAGTIETIKALVSLIFVAGIIFLSIKVLLFYLRRHNVNHYRPSMTANINENM